MNLRPKRLLPLNGFSVKLTDTETDTSWCHVEVFTLNNFCTKDPFTHIVKVIVFLYSLKMGSVQFHWCNLEKKVKKIKIVAHSNGDVGDT